MWNRDFSELYPSFGLLRLNQLEVAVLRVLRVRVNMVVPCVRVYMRTKLQAASFRCSAELAVCSMYSVCTVCAVWRHCVCRLP